MWNIPKRPMSRDINPETCIYDLKLFKSYLIRSVGDASERFFRVPGGWIFMSNYYGEQIHTFVPYSDEFKKLDTSTEVSEVINDQAE